MSHENRKNLARRGFVGQAIVGTMGLTAAGLDRPREPVESAPDPDVARLIRRFEQEKPKETWDLSWVDRCTGKYRQVFDAPEIAEGAVFHQARILFTQFKDVYDIKDADVSAVMVMRHAGIPMVANDRLWDELELGKHFKVPDPETGKHARRNPFLNANSPDNAKYGMIWPDGGLDTLLKRGAIGLCCNLALFRLVSMVAKKDGIKDDAARQKVLANLVPGLIVQPSGVFAVMRAEQAGCNYIRAS